MRPDELGPEHLPNGVTVERSPLGGLVVKLNGRLVGWIHQHGNVWSAVRRVPIRGTSTYTGRPLGSWRQAEAVMRIVHSAGWLPQERPKPPERGAPNSS